MDAIFDFFHLIIDLLRNPQNYVGSLGYWGLAAIIFLETGALVFFLPGDSILVVAGIYAAGGNMDLALLNAILIPCAIAGDALSYTIGKRAGPDALQQAEVAVLQPGSHPRRARVLRAARWQGDHPGAVHAPRAHLRARRRRRRRHELSPLRDVQHRGRCGVDLSMTCLGFFLGGIAESAGFPLQKHIEKVIIVVVFLSILPGIIAWWNARRAKAAQG
jgi:membrane-associated protein